MKVLVSEWSRRAAHNLDQKREEWEAIRSPSDYAEPELALGLKVDMRMDHEAVLIGPYTALRDLRVKVVNDIGILSNFLATMKATGKIDGTWYPKQVYEAYRARLAKELTYKQLLSTMIGEAMKTKRMLAHEPRFSYGDLPGLGDGELLSLLSELFCREMKAARGKEWFALLPEADQALVDYTKFRSRALRVKQAGIGTMEVSDGPADQ